MRRHVRLFHRRKHDVALSAVGLTQTRRASGPNTSSSLGPSCTMNCGFRKRSHANSCWIRSQQRTIVLNPSIGGRVIVSKRIRAQRRASPLSPLPTASTGIDTDSGDRVWVRWCPAWQSSVTSDAPFGLANHRASRVAHGFIRYDHRRKRN
jgi:hypothetical protein